MDSKDKRQNLELILARLDDDGEKPAKVWEAAGGFAPTIEGHTDPTPIRPPVFRSNWDLSGARAASVLQLFVARGLSEDRLSIAGYADRRPVTDNHRADGRQQNRRVDIVLIRPREPVQTARPAAKPAAGSQSALQ